MALFLKYLITILYGCSYNLKLIIMKHLCVSYETSKQLSILGFNEKCVGYYRNAHFMTRIGAQNSILQKPIVGKIGKIRLDEMIAAPTYHQAIDWLSKTFDVWLYAERFTTGIYDFTISSKVFKGENRKLQLVKTSKEALENGFTEIFKLIEDGEIVKIN